MVQLPDRSVFGNAPSGLSGRISVDYTGAVAPGRQMIETASRSGDGLRAFGAGVEKAGNALMAYANEEQQSKSRLDGAMANATSTIYEDNVKQAIENEQDPEKIKELISNLDAGYQSAGANLTGEEAQLFSLKSQHRANQLRLFGEKKIGAINQQSYMASAQNTLTELQNAYIRGDRQTQHDALDSAGRIFDNMAANGYITPEKAELSKNQFARGSVESFIVNQPVEKQFELLGVTPQSVNEAVGKGVSFFQSNGWQPHQAAAIMGHLLHESGGRLDPNAINRGDGADGSDSIGIGQWNGKRAKQLKAFAAANGKPWNDLGIQLAFAQHELETSESAAAAAIRAARNIDEAVAAGLKYERPKGYEGGIGSAAGGSQRLAYGRRIFGKLGKNGFDASPSAEGSYEIASNSMAGVLSPEEHAKLVNHAFAQRQHELSLLASQEREAERQRKAAVEEAQNDYIGRVNNGDFTGALDGIAKDPRLDEKAKFQLTKLIEREQSRREPKKGFGPAYKQALDDIANHRITDFSQILALENEEKLTPQGATRLKVDLDRMRRDAMSAGVTTTKAHMLAEAKRNLSFEDPSMPFLKDSKGEELFNTVFVPRFEREFDEWVKAGKNPYEFLDPKRIKPMWEGLRSPDDINKSRLSAIGGDGGETTPAPRNVDNMPLGQPEGVNEQSWKQLTSAPVADAAGKPMTPFGWSKALTILVQNRANPAAREAFNRKFPGQNADNILSTLGF